MVKRVLAGFVTCLMLASPLTYQANADPVPGEQFVALNPPTNDRYTGIKFAVGENDKNTISSLEAFTGDGTSGKSRMITRQVCKKDAKQQSISNTTRNFHFVQIRSRAIALSRYLPQMYLEQQLRESLSKITQERQLIPMLVTQVLTCLQEIVHSL